MLEEMGLDYSWVVLKKRVLVHGAPPAEKCGECDHDKPSGPVHRKMFDQVYAERDDLLAETERLREIIDGDRDPDSEIARVTAERDEARAQVERLKVSLELVCEHRDMWKARAETAERERDEARAEVERIEGHHNMALQERDQAWAQIEELKAEAEKLKAKAEDWFKTAAEDSAKAERANNDREKAWRKVDKLRAERSALEDRLDSIKWLLRQEIGNPGQEETPEEVAERAAGAIRSLKGRIIQARAEAFGEAEQLKVRIADLERDRKAEADAHVEEVLHLRRCEPGSIFDSIPVVTEPLQADLEGLDERVSELEDRLAALWALDRDLADRLTATADKLARHFDYHRERRDAASEAQKYTGPPGGPGGHS